jgi:ketosteroid isomerase-like protein
MSPEHNKAIFMRFMDEVGKGNLDVVDEVFSPDFVAHFPQYPNWPRGLKGARKVLVGARDVQDWEATIEDLVAEEDKVVVRWSIRGRYVGEPKPGSPTPNERFVQTSINIYRFADGRIVDDWGVDAFWKPGTYKD